MTYFEAFGGRVRLTGWRATFAAIGCMGAITMAVMVVI